MKFTSIVYSLYSYFVSPYLFIDKHKYSPIRPTSFLFTPFPTILYLSNPIISSSPKNISETEIKRFIEKIKKYSFKPSITNTFEEL